MKTQLTREDWITEIQRVATDEFDVDPATLELMDWDAYAEKYIPKGLSPKEALEHEIAERGW